MSVVECQALIEDNKTTEYQQSQVQFHVLELYTRARHNNLFLGSLTKKITT